MNKTEFRKVSDMTADEVLDVLRDHVGEENAVHQIEIFTRLGGDPDDHNYARLSFLTKALRRRGVKIGSSRRKGIWLEAA